MPCVRKQGCTHGIIVSICLICYIQWGFSISYLSIPGIVAHDRYNVSQISTFFVECHLYNCFSGGFKTGQLGRKVPRQECWVIIVYFKILDCLISFNVFYTHNQYNYPNNDQIINYSFKGHLLPEQWDGILFLFFYFFYFLFLIGSFFLIFMFLFLFVLL